MKENLGNTLPFVWGSNRSTLFIGYVRGLGICRAEAEMSDVLWMHETPLLLEIQAYWTSTLMLDYLKNEVKKTLVRKQASNPDNLRKQEVGKTAKSRVHTYHKISIRDAANSRAVIRFGCAIKWSKVIWPCKRKRIALRPYRFEHEGSQAWTSLVWGAVIIQCEILVA